MDPSATSVIRFRSDLPRLLMRLLGGGFILCALFAMLAVPGWADSAPELEYSPLLDHGLLGEGRQAYRERADLDRARDSYELFKKHLEQNHLPLDRYFRLLLQHLQPLCHEHQNC